MTTVSTIRYFQNRTTVLGWLWRYDPADLPGSTCRQPLCSNGRVNYCFASGFLIFLLYCESLPFLGTSYCVQLCEYVILFMQLYCFLLYLFHYSVFYSHSQAREKLPRKRRRVLPLEQVIKSLITLKLLKILPEPK